MNDLFATPRKALTCRCGSEVFEVIPSCRLLLHAFNPEKVDMEQVMRFRCSKCGVEMEIAKRRAEIQALKDAHDKAGENTP